MNKETSKKKRDFCTTGCGVSIPKGDKYCCMCRPETSNWEEEFDNRFWKHRVPRFTEQSKDIKDFIKERFISKKDLAMKIEKYEDEHYKNCLDPQACDVNFMANDLIKSIKGQDNENIV